MDNPDVLNSKSVKGFIKGSLVLIGLFAVLYCGVAALLICSDRNIGFNTFALILILIILPLIIFLTVFLRFSCLVKSYYNSSKINKEDFCFKEENIIKRDKIKIIGETCTTIAKSIKPDYDKNVEALQKIKEMLEIVSDISSEDAKASSKNSNDNPNNNGNCQ